MLNLDEIKKFLKDGNRTYIYDVRIRQSDDTVLIYVSRGSLTEKAKYGFVSLRQLVNLKKLIEKEYSCKSEYILVSEQSHEEIESGIFQLLNNRFEQQIQSLILSFKTSSVVDAWIEAKTQIGVAQEDVNRALIELLNASKLGLGNVFWIESPLNLPTLSYLLRVIKIHQPVRLEDLIGIISKEYRGIEIKWMKSTLDTLRRKELIVWQKPGLYSATYKALTVIPAGTSRKSSDIERALALARRKW